MIPLHTWIDGSINLNGKNVVKGRGLDHVYPADNTFRDTDCASALQQNEGKKEMNDTAEMRKTTSA